MTLDAGSGLSASALTTPGGRRLRYVHAGEGGPVVVFEAGMGACASEWVTVQRLVSVDTRTVAYDRAGHGGSTEDSQARTLPRICEDLEALVDEVSPGAPVVLVAHSWGGPIVRYFAEQHPERVAGMVMVDTTITAVMSEKVAKLMPAMMSVTRGLHAVGLAAPYLRRTLFKKVSPEVSAEDRAIIDRDMTSKQSAKTMVAESKAVVASLPLMKRFELAGLPDVPVISVMGAGTGRGTKMRETFIPVVEKEMANHPQGECRVIAGTDHYVPQDKPVETAQAILDVVQRARKA
jgi:pimeloyl-ACP methyl ester carboxylesterase